MEQLLALGSVVKVQVSENKKDALRMVVCGYFPHDKKTDRLYDYSAVLYPWGMQPQPALQMFNHGQITAIESAGYQDSEGEKFLSDMQKIFESYAEEVKKALQEAEEEKSEEKSALQTGETLEEFG